MTLGGDQQGVPYELLHADGSRAVFNDPTDPDYVGMARFFGLEDGDVREVADDRTDADGGVHGDFWRGRRPVVGNIEIVATSTTDRNQKYDKLWASSHALRSDAVLTWTPDGGAEQFVRLRKSGRLARGEDAGWLVKYQLPMIVAEPRRFSTTLHSADESTGGGTSFANLKAGIIALTPQLYWVLDAATGVTDQSGNGRNGTTVGSPTLGGGAALTSVTGDSSTDLNGSSQYVTSTYNPFGAGSALTVMGFAARDTTNTFDTLFAGSGAVPPYAVLGDSNQHAMSFDPLAGSGGASVGTTGLWPGTGAAHWAVTFDETSNAVQLFINGVLVYSGSTADNYSSPGNFQIGKSPVFADYFDGRESHIAVFSRVLTSDEILSIYALGSSATLTNAGNTESPTVIRVNGPAVNPTLYNATTDEALDLTYSLTSGHYLEVDFAAKTVLLDGVTNVYSAVTGTPQWWQLAPGVNEISVGASDFQIDWRDAWG